jgi:hypothetical protein
MWVPAQRTEEPGRPLWTVVTVHSGTVGLRRLPPRIRPRSRRDQESRAVRRPGWCRRPSARPGGPRGPASPAAAGHRHLVAWIDGWCGYALRWWSQQDGTTIDGVRIAQTWYWRVRPLIADRAGSLHHARPCARPLCSGAG